MWFSTQYREGELTAGRTVYISLPENMQVEEIAARPGQSVKAGDTVLTLQMEGLEEERDALSLEYKKGRAGAETGTDVPCPSAAGD